MTSSIFHPDVISTYFNKIWMCGRRDRQAGRKDLERIGEKQIAKRSQKFWATTSIIKNHFAHHSLNP
ncbi:hypothetical protein HI914_02935 [Erysiphe necator]|nr:hypothetical protein HI914_02935 [Erysiphe necator]